MNIYRSTLLLLMVVTMFSASIGLESIKDFPGHIATISAARTTQNRSWKPKEIIVTVWNSAEPDSSKYVDIARENYNLVLVDTAFQGLDVAEKNGLKVMFRHPLLDPATLNNPSELKKLDDLINTVKKYRALDAYFIKDEPGANKFSYYAKLVNYLRKKDPRRLAYINLLPIYTGTENTTITADRVDPTKIKYPTNLYGVKPKDAVVLAYLEYLRQFITVVKPDLISYDHYHLLKDKDGSQYFLNLALVSHVARDANLPFMNVIQAGKYEKLLWRLPTANEMRFQVYTTLTYGGKGINYFTYWGSAAEEGLYRDGKYSPLAKDVAKINAEIRKLSPALMAVKLKNVYHTEPLPIGGTRMPKDAPVKIISKGEFVVGLFGKDKKIDTFMITNRNYQQQQIAEVKLNFSGRRLEELDRKTGKWISKASLSSNRNIKLVLQPGDGRLFRTKS